MILNYFSKKIIKLISKIIIIYQRFSVFLPDTCRFYPSCSEYMRQAVIKYGIFKGMYLGIFRILRCHPFSKGGYDPLK